MLVLELVLYTFLKPFSLFSLLLCSLQTDCERVKDEPQFFCKRTFEKMTTFGPSSSSSSAVKQSSKKGNFLVLLLALQLWLVMNHATA